MSSTLSTQCQAHQNSRKWFRLNEGWALVCNTVTLCVSVWNNSVDSWIKVSEGSTTTLYYGGDMVFRLEARQLRLLYFKLLLMHYLVQNFFFTYHCYTWQTFIYRFYESIAYISYIQHTSTFIPECVPWLEHKFHNMWQCHMWQCHMTK
jgi:hypothetical protein